MKPKFKNTLAWEQAQLLMQPAYIRLMDNLRKELEQSVWEGSYQEVETPLPGHQMLLTYQERSVTVDIWTLCFQVCFLDYHPNQTTNVEIDTSLIDETGDVDWQRLETKTQNVVRQVFANLL
ncbi:MAG: hypothetical protein DSM107014_05570 [Gomphosphaeria aponina SAG 52.96 = DSM 107014]|uniref:Uncharacterized protein n=1 Tax=Gomphosphaeria aponina SAG 52.96 = DSM 107014 TaxID=1521640 RepID=A0A941GNF3_9CHRO|nr:hypothetical protein [Gomphosphaeria aponina SAG 52.96 = DSM 107014]